MAKVRIVSTNFMNCINQKGNIQMLKVNKKTYQTDIGLTLQITHDEQGIAVYIPELDLYTCADTESELLDAIVDLTEEYWLQLQANPELRESEPMRQHYFYYLNVVYAVNPSSQLFQLWKSLKSPLSLIILLKQLLFGCYHSVRRLFMPKTQWQPREVRKAILSLFTSFRRGARIWRSQAPKRNEHGHCCFRDSQFF